MRTSMSPEQIKQKVLVALEAINPSNETATPEEKLKAWQFIKETLLIIYP